MGIDKMRAIEYNLMMTILKLFMDNVPAIAHEYGITSGSISISPLYPHDLIDMEKPSIIVRRVDTVQTKFGLGSVLGQFFDEDIKYRY